MFKSFSYTIMKGKNKMKKYKICVYAICKNEEKFIKKWFRAMKEADDIYVLDTGSTDHSMSILNKLKIHTKQVTIDPWRFDVARNLSLDMVPLDTDICVCTDLDEIFLPGWRNKLERYWEKNTTRAYYTYNWKLDKNNKPVVSFYTDKIHARKNYKWVNPVHEVLQTNEEENTMTIDDIILNHYPDYSKSRSGYLPLLELAVKENPNNDRNIHYLGREYMYYGRWNDCIDTLIHHLNLKTATWKDERCASMRFIARSYINLKRYEEAKMWLDKAIKEAPYLREPYVERALLSYLLEDWESVTYYCNKALLIKKHPKTYINETFSFDNTIYDLLAMSYFYLGKIEKAIFYSNLALEMDPDNERLQNNHKIYLANRKI